MFQTLEIGKFSSKFSDYQKAIIDSTKIKISNLNSVLINQDSISNILYNESQYKFNKNNKISPNFSLSHSIHKIDYAYENKPPIKINDTDLDKLLSYRTDKFSFHKKK